MIFNLDLIQTFKATKKMTSGNKHNIKALEGNGSKQTRYKNYYRRMNTFLKNSNVLVSM